MIDERRCEAQTADPFEAILQECLEGSFVHDVQQHKSESIPKNSNAAITALQAAPPLPSLLGISN